MQAWTLAHLSFNNRTVRLSVVCNAVFLGLNCQAERSRSLIVMHFSTTLKMTLIKLFIIFVCKLFNYEKADFNYYLDARSVSTIFGKRQVQTCFNG